MKLLNLIAALSVAAASSKAYPQFISVSPNGPQIGANTATGTPGSLLYVDASKNLAQDNGHLFYDATNKRVGIGTSSPGYTLHVVGPVGATAMEVDALTANSPGLYGINVQGPNDDDSAFTLTNTNASGHQWLFRSHHTGKFEIIDATAGSTYMLIDTSGQVGVGHTPQATMDVNGSFRLAKFASASPPVACDSTHDGLIYLSTTYHLCVCKGGSTSYVLTSDGATGCS